MPLSGPRRLFPGTKMLRGDPVKSGHRVGHTRYFTEKHRERRRDDEDDDGDDDDDDNSTDNGARTRSDDERTSDGHTTTTMGFGARAWGPNTGVKGHRHRLARRCITSEERDGRDSAHSVGNRDTFARISGILINTQRAVCFFPRGTVRHSEIDERNERAKERTEQTGERAKEENEGSRTIRIRI